MLSEKVFFTTEIPEVTEKASKLKTYLGVSLLSVVISGFYEFVLIW
jgi:hypothetical protein